MGDATFNCPGCDRPTLCSSEDTIAAYECAACGELVHETGVNL